MTIRRSRASSGNGRDYLLVTDPVHPRYLLFFFFHGHSHFFMFFLRCHPHMELNFGLGKVYYWRGYLLVIMVFVRESI